MARRERQGIEIFDERLGIRRDDPPVPAEGEPPDLLPGGGIHPCGHEFGDGPLALPAHDEIDLRIVRQRPCGVKGDMGAAHQGDQRGAMPFGRRRRSRRRPGN